jgi:hypothetical protein
MIFIGIMLQIATLKEASGMGRVELAHITKNIGG